MSKEHYDIEKITATPEDILTDRTSSNGNPYTAIILPSGDWVFVWEGEWKTEIDENKEIYKNAELELYVKDKEDDPDDHFYNLKVLAPSSPELCGKLLKHRTDTELDRSEEEKEDLLEQVEQTFKD